MQVKLGIDLGTSNVVVAYVDGERPVCYAWEDLGQDALLPSYVQLRSDRVVVGRPARRAWEHGEPACHRRFKMHLGRTDGRSPTAEVLMTHLVEAVRRRMLPDDAERVSKIESIKSVIVTVPHGWSEAQRQATLAAVERGGLRVARLISEPVAAAAYYAHLYRLSTPETVLVCDMGGGTFDIALVRVEPTRRIYVVDNGTATNEAAGDLADALIGAAVLFEQSGQRIEAEVLLRDQGQKEIRMLLASVQQARERLNDAATVALEAGHALDSLDSERMRWIYDGQKVAHELDYPKMVQAMEPVCTQARQLISTLLAQHSGLKLHGAVLAGGMSRMLTFQTAIAQAVGMPSAVRRFNQNPDQAIALGAALVAAGVIVIDPRLPFGVGLVAREYATTRQVNHQVFAAGTSIPCQQSLRGAFRTETPQSQTLTLTIGLGDTDDTADYKLLPITLEVGDFLREQVIVQWIFTIDDQLRLTLEAQREDGQKVSKQISLSQEQGLWPPRTRS